MITKHARNRFNITWCPGKGKWDGKEMKWKKNKKYSSIKPGKKSNKIAF